MRCILLFLACLLSIIQAAPTIIGRSDSPLKPSDDPFYSPPSGYENEPLGSILRIRKKDNQYGMIVIAENVSAVYQILVRSEDTFKKPTAVLTTLFVPHNADPSKLVTYQIAEDSSNINCSPSYAMQLYSNPVTYVTAQLEQLNIVTALQEGWYVNVPDHEGPKSANTCGWSTAYTVLNSIKGVFNSANETGIHPDAEVVAWGYSGGGFASAWTSQVQPTYYPDLKLIGTAMGGILVNFTNIYRYNMGTTGSGFIFSAMNSLGNEYTDVAQLFKQKVKPDKYANFTFSNQLCLVEDLAYYVFDDWDDYFDEGISIMNEPVLKKALEENNLLTTGLTPKCPIFIYSSANDEYVPIEDTDSLYELYCSKGVSVEYRKDEISEHMSAAVTGAGRAFSFIKDRFNGVAVDPQCQTSSTMSNIFGSGSFSGMYDEIAANMNMFFGGEVGPS